MDTTEHLSIDSGPVRRSHAGNLIVGFGDESHGHLVGKTVISQESPSPGDEIIVVRNDSAQPIKAIPLALSGGKFDEVQQHKDEILQHILKKVSENNDGDNSKDKDGAEIERNFDKIQGGTTKKGRPSKDKKRLVLIDHTEDQENKTIY